MGMHRWNNTVHTNLKELRVAILLLDRITDGDYTPYCGKVEPYELYEGCVVDTNFEQWRKIEESDWKYMWSLLQKYMQAWWD